MNISLILAHPNPLSFNHAIAEAARLVLRDFGHTIFFHDLYKERFDPILWSNDLDESAELPACIKNLCDELMISGGIIIVHPNWWGQPPAILKGWIDRVFRPGVAHRFLDGDKGEGVSKGLLKAKTALVFNTSNTPKKREWEVFGDPLETLWKNCIFGLCGIGEVYRRTFSVVITSSQETRTIWLDEVKQIIERYFAQAV